MNAKDFNNLQAQRMHNLLRGPEPQTEWEHYIWALHYIEYSIKYQSPMYRQGFIRTIRNLINLLEKSRNEGKSPYVCSNPTYEDVIASMNDVQRNVMHELIGRAVMGE